MIDQGLSIALATNATSTPVDVLTPSAELADIFSGASASGTGARSRRSA